MKNLSIDFTSDTTCWFCDKVSFQCYCKWFHGWCRYIDCVLFKYIKLVRIYLFTSNNYLYSLVYHIVASQINVLLGIKLGSTVEIPFALTDVNMSIIWQKN